MPRFGLKRPTLLVLSRKELILLHIFPPAEKSISVIHPVHFLFPLGLRRPKSPQSWVLCSQGDVDTDKYLLGETHITKGTVESTSHLTAPHCFLPLPAPPPAPPPPVKKPTLLPSQPIWVWIPEDNASYWVAGLNLALTELFRGGINL